MYEWNKKKINAFTFFCSLIYDKNPGLCTQIPQLAYPMIPIPYKNFTMITSSRQNILTTIILYNVK